MTCADTFDDVDHDQHPHGTVKRYRAGPCPGVPGTAASQRCEPCRAAWAAYKREQRTGRAQSAPPRLTARPAAERGLDSWWDSVTAERLAVDDDDDLFTREIVIREIADPADGGRDCQRCGGAMRWTGGYTALICIAHHPVTWARDSQASQRAARHRARNVPKQASGPPPAEIAEVDEERAVALDDLAEAREKLTRIPRGDERREDAIRGLHKLEKLEAQYKAARSYQEIDAAHTDAAKLLGGDGKPGQLAAILTRAEKIARREQRTERGGLLQRQRGGLLQFRRRGGSDEYEYQKDDEVASGEAVLDIPLREVPAIPGRSTPLCDPCHSNGGQRPAVRRIDPFGWDGEQGKDVCAEHFAMNPAAQVVADYTSHSPRLLVLPGYAAEDEDAYQDQVMNR
jgi:hypothetical protein